jgi:hypothetical protein
MTRDWMGLHDWLKSIKEDGKIHHIGEYYAQRYGKPFQKKNSHATAAFKNWWITQNSNAIADIVTGQGFEILRDWDAYGFLMQKKQPKPVVTKEMKDGIL